MCQQPAACPSGAAAAPSAACFGLPPPLVFSSNSDTSWRPTAALCTRQPPLYSQTLFVSWSPHMISLPYSAPT